jgi:hypothetical protein
MTGEEGILLVAPEASVFRVVDFHVKSRYLYLGYLIQLKVTEFC